MASALICAVPNARTWVLLNAATWSEDSATNWLLLVQHDSESP